MFRTTSVPLEELLFAFDEEDDLASFEEDSGLTDDEDSPEELDATMELLLDSSLLLRMMSEEELLAGVCDELDSVAELLDTTGAELEDDSAPELLDCELLDRPYLE